MTKNITQDYNFQSFGEEQETIINIDHFIGEVIVYTSNKAIARRLHKRLGLPKRKDTYGAEWTLPLLSITSIPIGTFKTKKRVNNQPQLLTHPKINS